MITIITHLLDAIIAASVIGIILIIRRAYKRKKTMDSRPDWDFDKTWRR